MPKIRDHRQIGTAFLVSPWQSKHDKAPGAPPAAVDADGRPLMYAVVTTDTLLVGSNAQQQPQDTAVAVDALQQQGLNGPNTAASAAAGGDVDGARFAPKTACVAFSSSSSGWHTRPKRQPTTPPTPPAAAGATTFPAAAAAAAAAPIQVSLQPHTEQPSPLPHQHHHQQQHQQHQHQQQHQDQQQQAPTSPAHTGISISSNSSNSRNSELSADPTEEDTAADNPTQSQHTDATSEDWLAEAGTAAAVGHVSSTPTLQGVAQLVLHPSGAISGHFVAMNAHTHLSPHTSNPDTTVSTSGGSSSRRKRGEQSQPGSSSSSSNTPLCLGLQGRQVLGIHSCYRDPEWALLQLSIIRYSSSGDDHAGPDASAAAAAAAVPAAVAAATADVAAGAAAGETAGAAAAAAAGHADAAAAAAGAVFRGPSVSQAEAIAWVQRKGGDLVTLEPADFDDEDTEAAVLADNMGALPDNPTVNFTAHTLLSGTAAAALTQKTRPELVGQSDLVVNLGDMTITGLPVGFLTGN